MRTSLSLLLVAAVLAALPAWSQAPPGEEPALGTTRLTQDELVNELSLAEIIDAGMRVFTTPFNTFDGYGDGPLDLSEDPLQPGGRPTLQGNGTLLRVNGLDAHTCLDCHAVVSSATRPPTLGVGGVGTANNNAIIMPTEIDVADIDRDGIAGFTGRFANPPFVFGAGAVELLALEMTLDLQALKQQALASPPGSVIPLVSKGVHFGLLRVDAAGDLDSSGVEGVAADLVVRPFGRKGEFATIREFDLGAMQFHFGMQPVEVVGADFDDDGDGVTNEVTEGEISALSIFIASLERPFMERLTAGARRGFATFERIGCAGCHVPELQTERGALPLRLPEVPTDPLANVFYSVDLTRPPVAFRSNGWGGVAVPLFADLKRHDMGPGLAETFAASDARTNREFTTARLWGIADTAPYLHDGRATTLTEAITAHGGEAQAVRDGFVALPDSQKSELLEFLRSLRTPKPARGRSRVVGR